MTDGLIHTVHRQYRLLGIGDRFATLCGRPLVVSGKTRETLEGSTCFICIARWAQFPGSIFINLIPGSEL